MVAAARHGGGMTYAACMLLGIGPRIGTALWQPGGPGSLWASCLGFAVLIAIALAATGPARRRRMALGA
jgi:hypothetical protein